MFCCECLLSDSALNCTSSAFACSVLMLWMHSFHCCVYQTVNMNAYCLGKWKNYLYGGVCENEICWELAQAVWSVQHQWASTNGNSSETKQYLAPVYPTAPDWHYLAPGRLSLPLSALRWPFVIHSFYISAALSLNSQGMRLNIDNVFPCLKCTHDNNYDLFFGWKLWCDLCWISTVLFWFFPLRKIQPVDSENINEAVPQLHSIAVKWSMSHTGLTLEKELIDRCSDGLMTDSIPPGTGWQKDISGKLCTNRHSSHRAPFLSSRIWLVGQVIDDSCQSAIRSTSSPPPVATSASVRFHLPSPGRFDRVEPHRI